MNKLQVPVVLALIYDDAGKVLIARRHQPGDDRLHNKWELVGGKVDFGETPEEAIVREVKEESGLKVEVVSLMPKIHQNTWDGQHGIQVFLMTYICKTVGGEIDRKASDQEIAELRFISPREIHSYDCLPLVQEIISEGSKVLASQSLVNA